MTTQLETMQELQRCGACSGVKNGEIEPKTVSADVWHLIELNVKYLDSNFTFRVANEF